MNTPPTITDVAKAAGVSLSAVSFVLNGKADKYRISPTTQARIRAAISQLDFHPTQAARDITKGQSRDSYRAAPEPTPVPDVVAAVPSGDKAEPESPSIQLESESVAPPEETKTVPSTAPQADTQQSPPLEPTP